MPKSVAMTAIAMMAMHTIGWVTVMVTVIAVAAAPGCEQTDRRGFSWTAEVGESPTQVS